MLMAIPIWQGRVSPVLDVAARLLLVRFARGRQTDRQEVLLARNTMDGLCARLRAWGVDHVICAALSDTLEHSLVEEGMRVTPGVCGEVEAVLQSYQAGGLRQPDLTMPGRRRVGPKRGPGGCARVSKKPGYDQTPTAFNRQTRWHGASQGVQKASRNTLTSTHHHHHHL
jgi:predicted Fe-Mo cluster-binding NifX family protein